MSSHVTPSATLPALTGLRGVAALWVLLYHIQAMGDGFALPKSVPILRDGWLGVDMFFVLSGFILMLVHGDEFRAPHLARVASFLRLRFFRVYPLATVVLLAIVLLVAFDPGFAVSFAQTGKSPNLSLEALLRTLALATRWWTPLSGDWNQPVWSLSVEVLGYIAFPVLACLALLLTRAWQVVVIAMISLSLPTVVALQDGVGYGNIEMWGALSRMFGAFIGGMMVCRLHQLAPSGWRATRGWLAVPAAFAAALFPVGVAVFAFAALIYGLAANIGPVNWVLKHPVAMFLGRISFPLFLLHVMPLSALAYHLREMEASDPVRWVALALLLIVLAAMSWLLHVYVEVPVHRFARARYVARATPIGAGA